MDEQTREELLDIKKHIDKILEDGLMYIGEFYGEKGKYSLYLYPKSTEKKLNWDNAIEYCTQLGGELPNIGEMQFLWENNIVKEEFEYKSYWSSIDYISNKTHYSHFFYHGNLINGPKIYECYARAIRRQYHFSFN